MGYGLKRSITACAILERLLEVDADESLRARLDALLGKRRAEDDLEQCLAGEQVYDIKREQLHEGAPTARYDYAKAWTGREMIVWGGTTGGDSGTLNSGASYDPTTDTWAPLAFDDAPTPRRTLTSVWTGSAFIVWGGYSGSTYFNTGGRYVPWHVGLPEDQEREVASTISSAQPRTAVTRARAAERSKGAPSSSSMKP